MENGNQPDLDQKAREEMEFREYETQITQGHAKRKRKIFWFLAALIVLAGAGYSFMDFLTGADPFMEMSQVASTTITHTTMEAMAPPHAVAAPMVAAPTMHAVTSATLPLPPVVTPPVPPMAAPVAHVAPSAVATTAAPHEAMSAGKAASPAPMLHTVPAPTEAPKAKVPDSSITLEQPEDKGSWQYDETAPAPVFSWKGAPVATLLIGHDPELKKSMEIRKEVEGMSYAFHVVLPGKYYWKVVSASGASEVRSFTVFKADKRNVEILSPKDGESVSANSIKVMWKGDEEVRM